MKIFAVFCPQCPLAIIVEAEDEKQALRKLVTYVNENSEDFKNLLAFYRSDLKYLTVKQVQSMNHGVPQFLEFEDPICTKEWLEAAVKSGSEPVVWTVHKGIRVAKYIVRKNTKIL